MLFGRSTEQNVECVRTEMDSVSVLIGDELEFLLGFFTAFGNFLQSFWENRQCVNGSEAVRCNGRYGTNGR